MFNAYGIIIGLFLAFGIITTLWGWRILAQGRKTLQWPNVEGIIEESSLSSAGNDDLFPQITFRYSINGETFQDTLKFSRDITPTQEFAKSYVEKYPVGRQVQVYYDPSQPARATLEPGSGQGDWLVLAIGMGMTIFGILFLFVGY
jgi:hypothetical protein